MKNIWRLIGITIALIAIAFAGYIGKTVGKSTGNSFFGGKKADIQSTLMQAANRINKDLPIMVDSETRLDSAIPINNTFRYNYTLVNHTADYFDSTAVENEMRPRLINLVCSEMKTFVANGVPITYAYHGKNGQKITAITIHPSECNSQ